MSPKISNLLIVCLILSVTYLQLSTAYQAPPPSASPPSVCNVKCATRCSKAGYKDRCLKYCNICCVQCKDDCVPSGTYGNKGECKCYAALVNSKGVSKCP